MPNGEPGVITIKHILIAFKDSGTKATRSREDAEKLAYDLVGRAKAGEDFDKLMKEFSDDSPEGGTYTMVNEGLQPAGEEFARSGPRGMVKAFGDVGFRILVGEIGVAEHHASDSPYGWHIIKRIK
jgi:parvulin-like peptidyl-prolyl isomerase